MDEVKIQELNPELIVDVPWKYRKPCPDDMALVVVHEGRGEILDHIGPGLQYVEDSGMRSDYFDPCCEGQSSGVFIWEGRMATETYANGEHDYYLDGTFRPATKEEWYAYLEGKPPWDPSRWVEG
jgi:hypothetical protein